MRAIAMRHVSHGGGPDKREPAREDA